MGFSSIYFPFKQSLELSFKFILNSPTVSDESGVTYGDFVYRYKSVPVITFHGIDAFFLQNFCFLSQYKKEF